MRPMPGQALLRAAGQAVTTRPLAFYCEVYGQPAPQGSKRHVGGGRMVESNEKTLRPWREAVKEAARQVIDRAVDESFSPLRGPLRIEVIFTLRKPTSAPKRRRTWPDRKPDADKLLRGVFDALVDAGVVVDDAQFVDARAVKTFPGEGDRESERGLASPGCVVRIWKVIE